MEISGEYLVPQLAVTTSHLYRPPSSTARLRIVRYLQSTGGNTQEAGMAPLPLTTHHNHGQSHTYRQSLPSVPQNTED